MQRYFKLETYIGKLVMSYLNTYVKLRDDQIATSLWDGDVILTHLELRCHSLDHLLPHPLRFRSGQVHELRIHIPWTKLNSENIVITLNTVECILALESSERQTTVISTEPSVSNSNALNTVDGQEFVATEAPGYLQSYLNRLISNVRFVVQNLNIKFLQDDIVLSMSSNRVEFFPTDAQWQSSYQFDHSSANYMVHRKLQIFDITLCLDQAGPSGFVDVYEEPIIYRFHLSCLIELVFSGDSKTSGPNATTIALVTTLNVHADKLDCRISPAQMHAVIRLLDVFSAIHSETVNWSVVGPCTNPRPPDLVNADAQGVEETRDDPVKQSVDSEQADSQSSGSWASWVWSFVPSLLPPTVESSEDEGDEAVSEELLTNSRRSATELFRLVYEDAEKQLLDGLPYISHSASENLNLTMPDNHSVAIGQLDGFESFEKATETNKPEDRALAKQRRRRIRALKCQLGKTSLLSIGVFIDQLVVQLTLSDWHRLSGHTIQTSGLVTKRGSKRLDPALRLDIRDLAFQATAHGLNFISVQLGVRYLEVTPDGPGCSCGYPDVQSTSESIGDVDTADASAGQTVPIPCSAEFNDPDVQCRSSCPVPMFTFGRDRIDVPQTVPRSRSLFFSQMHNSGSHVDLSSDDAFGSTSSVVELPVLELDEYYSKFNDTCVRDLFPAVWFDLISVVDAEKSDIKIDELPPVRHKHTNGLRESILIRFLSVSVVGNVSPSGLHRLTALIQRVNSYPAYPCCRLPVTNSDYVSMVPGQIGDHVPTQSIQLEISDLVINCYAEHVKCQAPYEHISLQAHSVQWILKSPMYPLDISNSLRLCKISRETWHDMADFIMCAECWQSESGGAPATGHPMLLSHYLSFAFTRSRIQIDGISARIALIDTGASNELTERPLRCTPLLSVSSCSCFSWSSGCPDLWASNTEFALLSSSEFRLKMENPIQLVLDRESSPVLLCLITSLWHHAGEVCSSLKSGRDVFCSPTKTDWTDGLYLQKRHSVRSEQESRVLRCDLGGPVHCRLLTGHCTDIFQLVVERDFHVFLFDQRNLTAVPVLEHISSSVGGGRKPYFVLGDTPEPKTIPDEHPLVSVSCQFSRDVSSKSAYTLLSATVGDLHLVTTPDLFNWFSWTVSDHQHRHSMNPVHAEPFPSVRLKRTAVGWNGPTCNLFDPASFHQSSALVHLSQPGHVVSAARVLKSLESEPHPIPYTRKSGSQTLSNAAPSTRVSGFVALERFFAGKHRLFECSDVQLSIQPCTLTILTHSLPPVPLNKRDPIKDPGYFTVTGISLCKPFLSHLGSSSPVQLRISHLTLDNTVRSRRSSMPSVGSHPSCACGLVSVEQNWDKAVRQLPLLEAKMATHSTPWVLQTVGIQLAAGNHIIFNTSILVSLDCRSVSTHSRSTSDVPDILQWCIHMLLSCEELPSRLNSGPVPSFDHLLACVVAFSFLMDVTQMAIARCNTLRSLVTTTECITSELESGAQKMVPPTSSVPVDSGCFSSLRIVDRTPTPSTVSRSQVRDSMRSTSSTSFAIVPTMSKIGGTRVFASPPPVVTTSCSPISLWIQFHVPSVIGQLAIDTEARSLLGWYVRDAAFIIDIRPSLIKCDLSVDTVVCDIRQSERATIPILTPLESALKPFQDYAHCPGPLSSPHASDVPYTTSVQSGPIVSRQSQLADSDTAGSTCTALPNSGVHTGSSPIHFSQHECQSPIQTPSARGPLATLSCIASLNRTVVTSNRRPSKGSIELEADVPRWNVRILCNPLDFVVHPLLVDLLRRLSTTFVTVGLRKAEPPNKHRSPLLIEMLSSYADLQAVVRSPRIFFCPNKLEAVHHSPGGQGSVDTLVVSVDSVELKPLTDNRLERPSAFHVQQSPDHSFPNPHVPVEADSQYTLIVHALAVQAVDFRAVAQSDAPHAWSSRMSDVDARNRTDAGLVLGHGQALTSRHNLTPDHQNPAQFWNQSNWSQVSYTTLVWPVVEPFSFVLSYAPPLYDQDYNLTDGCAFELAVSGDLVFLFHGSVLTDLFGSHGSMIASAGNPQLNSVTDPELHNGILNQKIGNHEATKPGSYAHGTPIQALLTARCLRMVSWNPSVEPVPQLVVDLVHPHLIVEHNLRLDSWTDRVEFVIHDVQMDLRQSDVPIGSSGINWYRYKSPTHHRDSPRSSVVQILLPPLLNAYKLGEPDSQSVSDHDFLFTTELSEPNPRTGMSAEFLCLRFIRPQPCGSTPNKNREEQSSSERLQMELNIKRAVRCRIYPDMPCAIARLLSAFRTDHPIPVKTSSSVSRAIGYWIVRNSDFCSFDVAPVSIHILPDRNVILGGPKSGHIRFEWQTCTGQVAFSHPNDVPWNRVKWLIHFTRLSLVCSSGLNQPGKVSELPILWPRTDLALCGMLRLACCIHTTPRSYFLADSNLVFNVNLGLQIELPVQGQMFNVIHTLLNKYLSVIRPSLKKCSLSVPSAPSSSRSFCDQCVGLAPVFFRDELRERDLLSASMPNRNCPNCHSHLSHHHHHPCWPWTQISRSTVPMQWPLSPHPWPTPGELVFCDNLKSEFYVSPSAPAVQLESDAFGVENHWIGITWCYSEPRTPVRVRLLPVPFGFVERYREDQILTGLELPCQLQYWDCSRSPGGQFVTYATFSLPDSQITEWLLVVDKRDRLKHYSRVISDPDPRKQTGLESILDRAIRAATTAQHGKKPNLVQAGRIAAEPCEPNPETSSPPPIGSSRVSSELWRILVDLRARPFRQSPSPSSVSPVTAETPDNSSQPVALVHISPLMLAGSVQLDSVQYQTLVPQIAPVCHLFCPALRMSLIQQNPKSMLDSELARLQLQGVRLTYQPNPIDSYASPNRQLTWHVDIIQFSVIDPRIARVQTMLSVGRFSGHVNHCAQVRNTAIVTDLFLGRIRLLVGLDRLIALRHLVTVSNSVVKLFCSTPVVEDNASLIGNATTDSSVFKQDVQWTVVNASDQTIVLQQLCPFTPLLALETPKSCSVDVDISEPFRYWLGPDDRLAWRPVLLPGRFPDPPDRPTCVRLQFGIMGPGDGIHSEKIIWAQPVECAWPPCGAQSQTVSSNRSAQQPVLAVPLSWSSEIPDNASSITQVNYPRLTLLAVHSESECALGELIIRSDLVVRNLLPTDLQMEMQTISTLLEADQHPFAKDLFNQPWHTSVDHCSSHVYSLHSGPSARNLSTWDTLVKCDTIQDRLIQLRFASVGSDMALQPLNNWSDPVQFRLTRPGTNLVPTQLTSIRTLISFPPPSTVSMDDAHGPFLAILTLEFRSLGVMAPALCVVTVSPLFQVISTVPSSIQLQARAIHRYSSTQEGSNSDPISFGRQHLIESVPGASVFSPVSPIDAANGAAVWPEEVRLAPYRMACATELLFDAHSISGVRLFHEPIRLTADQVLLRLASGSPLFDRSNATSSHVELLQLLFPVVYTVDTVLPSCLGSPQIISDTSLYSARLILSPAIRIVNRSGLDLLIEFTEAGDRVSNRSRSVHNLPDRAVCAMPLNRSWLRFGSCPMNSESYWSTETIILDPAEFQSVVYASLEQSAQSGTVRCCSLLSDPTSATSPIASGLHSEFNQIRMLPKNVNESYHVTVILSDRIICLAVRLLEDRCGNAGVPFFVLSVESRVHIMAHSRLPLVLKCLVVPIPLSSENHVTPVSVACITDSVNLCCSELSIQPMPLPQWTETHPALICQTTCELLFAISLSMSMDQYDGWSALVCLSEMTGVGESDMQPRGTPDEMNVVRHVSVPATCTVHEILIQTIIDPNCGTATLHLYDLPPHMDLSPLSLELTNHTQHDLAVELFETDKSERLRFVRDHVRRAVCETIPILARVPSHIWWIPQRILTGLFTLVASTGFERTASVPYSLFLAPDQLHQIMFRIYLRSNTATHLVQTLLSDMCEQSMNQIYRLNTESPEVSLYAFTSTRNTGSGLRLQLTSRTDLSCLSDEKHRKPYNVICTLGLDQLAVSFLRDASFSFSRTHGDRREPRQVCTTHHLNEFLRLTMRSTNIHLLVRTNTPDNQNHRPGASMDIDMSVRHIQLDNWAQAWTACYDFPVPFATTDLTKLRARLSSHSLTSLLQSPIMAVFFFPSPFVLTLEDRFLYDLCELLQSFRALWQDRSETRRLQCAHPLLIQCVHVHQVTARVSLRAMLRFYLSCHEAPLNLAPFGLCSTQPTSSGLSITVTELQRLIVMHYFTQTIFRVGWLVGSLDMLGNVTGLLQSLAHGIDDLIHLRTPQSMRLGRPDKNEGSPLMDKKDAAILAMSLQVDDSTQQEYVTLGTMDYADHPSGGSISYTARSSFLKRLGGGLNSLARHTTGGLLRSVTGMAASVARNLDHLSLDPQHQLFQEQMRRSTVPRTFSEGVLAGLNGFGLCVLGALAGLTDQPLQALFNALDPVEPDGTSKGDSNSVLALRTLGGLGRGLVGAVVKPVAGAAELIAQTGMGVLHHGELNSGTSSSLQRLDGPYITALDHLLVSHFSVDLCVLRTWALAAIQSPRSLEYVSVALIYKHPSSRTEQSIDSVVWLLASLDNRLIGGVAIPRAGRTSLTFRLFKLPTSTENKLVDHQRSSWTDQDSLAVFDPPELVRLYKHTLSESTGLSTSEQWIPDLRLSPCDSLALAHLFEPNHAHDTDAPLDSPQYPHFISTPPSDEPVHAVSASRWSPTEHPFQSRWQRVKEYLMSTKSAEPVVTV